MNGDITFVVVASYRSRIVTPAGTVQTTVDPPDANIPCAGTANVSFGLVQAAPAVSETALALLALILAAIAVVAIRR